MISNDGFPLVWVVWDDAWCDADGITPHDVHLKHRATVMQTVGWLLFQDERGITIANERCLDQGDETYRGRTFIPASLIRSVTPIVKPKRGRKKVESPPLVEV